MFNTFQCADSDGLSKLRKFKEKFVPGSIRGSSLLECYLLHAQERLSIIMMLEAKNLELPLECTAIIITGLTN